MGSQGDADDLSSDDWASQLAGHTVDVQLEAQARSEGRAAEPARGAKGRPEGQAQEKPKLKPDSRKAGGTPALRADAEDDSDDAEDDEREEGRGTGAILPEDDADSEDDADADADGEEGADDGEGGDDDDDGEKEETPEQKKLRALERDNFNGRQKLRESKAELKARDERIAALEKQVAEKGGGTGGVSLNGLPAGFEHVKGVADLDAMEARLQQMVDWAEDNADGYAGKDGAGAEVEYTPQQIRQWRRQQMQGLKQVEKAREVLRARGERESKATAEARVKYPFVLDAGGPHAALVRKLAEEHPEVGQSPERALLLGRLTVARLIEEGTYEITRKAKPKGKREGKPEGRPTSSTVTPPSPPPARRRAVQPEPEDASAGDNWAMGLARISMPGHE